MKNNLWKVVVLSLLVPGLLIGCGSEAEERPATEPVEPTASATPVPVASPTDTPVPSKAEEPLPPTASATPEPVAPPTDTPIPPAAESETGAPPVLPAGSVVDDFEGGDFEERWWSSAGEGTVSFACGPDQPGHASEQALRLTFEVGVDGYANCGLDVEPDQWGEARGLSFAWQADQADLTVIVALEMEDPRQTNPETEGVTPFEVVLKTPGQAWAAVSLTWDEFSKAEWVGQSGDEVLDPNRVVGLSFEVVGAQSGSVWIDDLQLHAAQAAASPTSAPVPSPTLSEVEGEAEEAEEAESGEPSPEPVVVDKWSLWVDGPHLRGANIWQAVVIPELDGSEFKGPGPVGPPYSQEDFNRLAAMGANYVSISGPGLFTKTPPYTVDPGVEAYLDDLLAKIAEADMFATIGFRTGPGRSEFSLCCGGDPYYEGYFNDSVWQDQAAQEAWVEMWRYTAERYGDNPIVAGYKLMVEPNAPGVLLDIYDPEEFYAEYAGSLYDWNQFYPRLVAGIREVDANTPILVGGMGWSSVEWLPYLQPTDDPRTVYVVHQYAPQDQYTHQEPDGENTYPGVFDANWDGEDDQFDRAWLDNLLSTVDTFVATHGVPVAADEYGVIRWVPDAAEFMEDEMDLFEQRGMNYALWEWQTSWAPFAEETGAFDFRLGPDPNNRADVTSNDLMDVITQYWGRNTIRPSNLTTVAAGPEASPEPTAGGGDWWQPAVDSTWQWQLSDLPVDPSFEVDMYDIEMFDNEASVVEALQAQGRKVVCYISVGSWEEWRPDQDQFPASVIGKDYGGWPGEKWLDIRQIELLAPIMRARLDECKAKGFDGVEPDNIDGYTNDTGFPLTYEDQLNYNIWLANEAHARGLSIGLKNDSDQVADLLPYFDWALTEDCFAEGWCEQMRPFVAAGKPVFAAEYTDTGITTDQFCAQAQEMKFSAILKNRDLDAWREACP